MLDKLSARVGLHGLIAGGFILIAIPPGMHPFQKRVIFFLRRFLAVFGALLFQASAQTGQPVTSVVDGFNPEGTRGFSYSGGQIGSVWSNWFGAAFQSLSWDAAADADDNAGSGSMKIVANFPGTGSNQFTVINGFNGISPSVSARQFTALECDVKFAPGSATYMRNGAATFGYVEFGMATPSYGQLYFGGAYIPATATGWVHLKLLLDPATNPNLLKINNVMVHIWGGTSLVGASTLWVDNLKFTGTTVSGTATVDYASTRQRIDGFGASSAWASTWSTAEADLFFSTGPGGIGLSLLRNRIAPDGTTWETNLMQMAQARGARVWSAPWSPPASYKDSNSVNGGNFISSPANYQNYANQLANYVASVKTASGVHLDALSIQNEPNASTTYESCVWTPEQIHDFVPYLAEALASRGVGSTKILLPESMHWEFSLAVPTMGDAATARHVGILGGHNYGSSAAPITQFGSPVPKPLWETEHYIENQNPAANGLELAREIHDFMTIAEANAYHYWWLRSSGTGSLAGDSTASPAKRLYVMGNYSKFVRPGFHRVGVTNTTTALVSAYKDPENDNFVIVAANPTEWPVTQTFDLTSCPAVTSLNQWVTSGTLSLASQPPVAVSAGTFSYELPAYSVVTFSPGNGPRRVVALKTNDAINTTSFNAVGNWNDTVGPSADKDYTASRYVLRTPGAAGNHSFAGHSLALPPQAILRFKGANNSTVTIPRLILDGGRIENGNGNSSFTLAGRIAVNANSVISASSDASRAIIIAADLTGDGDLVNGSGGPGTVTYSGNNAAFTGAMIVNGGCILTAASQTNLGGDPDYSEPGQLTLDHGVFQPTASFSFNLPHGGVTLGAGGGTFNIGHGLALTVETAVTGAGSLAKTGAGTLVITGTDDHAGATTVSAGNLATCGSTGSGPVSVANGAVLTGTGDLAGAATINGTLAPEPVMGFPAGLTIGSTGRIQWDLTANSPAAADQVSTGVLTAIGGATLDITLNSPGSTTDFSDSFWQSTRRFPVVVTAAMSGSLTLGTVTTDAGGRQPADFGSFALQHSGSGLDLLWTPLPSVLPPVVTVLNPTAAWVSLSSVGQSLHLTAGIGGGTGSTLVWSLVSGPGVAAFVDPAAADTWVSFTVPGTYVLRCTATNDGGSSSADVTVLVASSAVVSLQDGVNGFAQAATFIRGDNPTWNSGARDQIVVGRLNSGLRGLLSFAIPALPSGATVNSATLEVAVVQTGSGTTLGALELHRLLTRFTEGTGDGLNASNGTGSGADWNTRTGSAAEPWTTPGGGPDADYESASLSNIAGFNPSATAVGTVFTFPSSPEFTAAVTAAAGTAEPMGLMLKAAGDTAGDNGFARFGADDHPTVAWRPKLTIECAGARLPDVAPGAAPAAEPGQVASLAGVINGAQNSSWSLVSGPGSAVFADASQPSGTVTFSSCGSYVLRLAAANAVGATSATLAVDVRDRTAPVIAVPADISVESASLAGAVVSFTATAADAVDGQVPTISSPASGAVFPPGETTVTVTATDASGNTAEETFSVTVVLIGFEAWRLEHFGSAELADPAVSGPLASPAGDGISNLVKYALGLPPKTPSTTGIELSKSGGVCSFTYQRPAKRPDLAYQVEISPDLGDASWTSDGVTHERVAPGDPETWQATYTPGPTKDRLFFRLKISRIVIHSD